MVSRTVVIAAALLLVSVTAQRQPVVQNLASLVSSSPQLTASLLFTLGISDSPSHRAPTAVRTHTHTTLSGIVLPEQAPSTWSANRTLDGLLDFFDGCAQSSALRTLFIDAWPSY